VIIRVLYAGFRRNSPSSRGNGYEKPGGLLVHSIARIMFRPINAVAAEGVWKNLLFSKVARPAREEGRKPAA
jgi:hypothetical protein